ncbi:hypothetical protein [Aeoliella sp.]|uniref:hypothetical protein n=1 Tax=Aeoliella sp. TaxID=2795800 RepID=UPI003CCB84E8
MSNLLKPIALTIVGIALFFVWMWLGMSTIDYQPGAAFFGLQTAGWFYLGLPFMFFMALVATLPFSFLARKFGSHIGWAAMLVVAFAAIGGTFYSALPTSRVASALNVEVPAESILHLRSADSFNDGTHTYGIVAGSPELMQKIAKSNDLSEGTISLLQLRLWSDDEALPEYGNAFESDLLTCYHDTTSDNIYFYRRSSLPNP